MFWQVTSPIREAICGPVWPYLGVFSEVPLTNALTNATLSSGMRLRGRDVTRMADLPIDAIINLNLALARNLVKVELAGVECVTLVAHGGGMIPWSLVETPSGERVRVLNDDIEPAIASID